MKYIGAVIVALAQAFVDYVRHSYRTSSKLLLLIRTVFVLITVVLSTVTVRAIISSSDDDIQTFSDGFRVIFGAFLINVSIATIIFLCDFTFLLTYLQTTVLPNRCRRLFGGANETTSQL